MSSPAIFFGSSVFVAERAPVSHLSVTSNMAFVLLNVLIVLCLEHSFMAASALLELVSFFALVQQVSVQVPDLNNLVALLTRHKHNTLIDIVQVKSITLGVAELLVLHVTELARVFDVEYAASFRFRTAFFTVGAASAGALSNRHGVHRA